MWDETFFSGTGRKAQAGADVPGKFLDFEEVERLGASNASSSLLVKWPIEEDISD